MKYGTLDSMPDPKSHDIYGIKEYPESYPDIHYENTPIQIYRKFDHQKLKVFR